MSRGVMGSNYRNRRYEGGGGENDRWRWKNFAVFQQDRNRACEMSEMSSDTYTDPNRNRMPWIRFPGSKGAGAKQRGSEGRHPTFVRSAVGNLGRNATFP